MATIAKGMITLVNVNDAYSVSVTPSACAIKADFDGSNPVLDEAFCDIAVVRGDTKVPFSITSHHASNNGITYNFSGTSILRRMTLTAIPSNTLSGNVEMDIATEDEFVATVIFQYSVTREATMLDWIQDWETNKTTVGSTYLITPKLFVGKKEVDNSLTGVYIGPSFADYIGNTSPGLFGYKAGQEIFHIDQNGGSIGGWIIENGGIHTADNKMQILSEGSILAYDASSNLIYGLYKDGEAVFAKRNVLFHSDGSAYFKGQIVASTGVIGGWEIGATMLKSHDNVIELDAANNAITVWPSSSNAFGNLEHVGGVRMYYSSALDYGIVAYLPEESETIRKTFQLGSTNIIAGWNFDNTALYRGTKVNSVRNYTSASGDITIGTAGIRGYGFYIDNTGEISFCNGSVQFNTSSGTMVGWTIASGRLATDQVALVSDSGTTGLYMTAADGSTFKTRSAAALENYIDSNGGIYMKVKTGSADFAAYDSTGYRLFKIKSGGQSYIAGWCFDNTTLYTGTAVNTRNQYTATGEITIGPAGLRGFKWRFENDGSGAVAGGNISWDANGAVTFSSSVSLNWTQGIGEAKNDASAAAALANKLSTISKQMAYGKMLYRDPEFVGNTYNSTLLYPHGIQQFLSFDASLILSTLQNSGLQLKGTSANITKVDIVHSDETVSTIWSGSTALSADTTTTVVESTAFSSLVSTDVIRIQWTGEASQIQVAEISTVQGDNNPYTWHNLYGYSTNEGTAAVACVREKVTDNTASNSTHSVMRMTCTRWATETDYRLGGFFFANQSRANSKFVVRLVAKIPVGFQINNYHNQYGDNATTEWLTSQAGTGNYEEYLCLVTCGASGTFSTINHFALTMIDDGNPYHIVNNSADSLIRYKDSNNVDQVLASVVWSVAYVTVIDLSSSDKLLTTIDINGIYTGTLRADQIVAGTIDATQIDASTIISNGQAWALNKDGSGYLANGNISWDANGANVEFTGKIVATSGSIGGFTIGNGHIGVSTTASGESFGNLSIYNDFFKVGGSKGYVMFGNDVIPATAGGAFTAVGRIVNQAPNTYGGYGFDQANYGLFINVSGGTKNYGIHSNAALMAPAFINTKCKLLDFSNSDTYSVDFSQYNVILMYYNKSGYSGTNVSLPSESSVASKFGLSSLPNDFATIVIFRVRQGSLPITLEGIYNANESSQNYTLASGDSVMVLITKADGFRYQILNHSS